MNRVALWAFWVWAIAASVGCGGARQKAPPSADALAHLRVVARPPGTRVYNDDVYLGMGAALEAVPASLKPGKVHLAFTAEGHYPEYVTTTLSPGLTTVTISLAKIPELGPM